jgi:hypothetical protein
MDGILRCMLDRHPCRKVQAEIPLRYGTVPFSTVIRYTAGSHLGVGQEQILPEISGLHAKLQKENKDLQRAVAA